MHKISGLFLLVFLVSCNATGEDVIMNNVDNKWNKKTEQKFNLEISDPQNPKNIIFVVRNNNDYPYSNLFLITYLKAENEKNFKTIS